MAAIMIEFYDWSRIRPITSHGYLKVPANATVFKKPTKNIYWLIPSLFCLRNVWYLRQKIQLISASHGLEIRVLSEKKGGKKSSWLVMG